LFSTGYVFGNTKKIQIEPSTLFQYVDQTKEKIIDLNVKAYKEMELGTLWGGLSYRRSLEKPNTQANQRLQYLTPIVGINYKQFMFAYTYSHLIGDIKFDQGGFHQITLGINIFCKRERYDCACPAIN